MHWKHTEYEAHTTMHHNAFDLMLLSANSRAEPEKRQKCWASALASVFRCALDAKCTTYYLYII